MDAQERDLEDWESGPIDPMYDVDTIDDVTAAAVLARAASFSLWTGPREEVLEDFTGALLCLEFPPNYDYFIGADTNGWILMEDRITNYTRACATLDDAIRYAWLRRLETMADDMVDNAERRYVR